MENNTPEPDDITAIMKALMGSDMKTAAEMLGMPLEQLETEIAEVNAIIHAKRAEKASMPTEKPVGLSPNFEDGGIWESDKLTKRGIKRIARRSGKSEDELWAMREVAKKQGRTLTVRYRVVDDA